jgi:hypothetical protein
VQFKQFLINFLFDREGNVLHLIKFEAVMVMRALKGEKALTRAFDR